jgi:hypothetical protein
MFTMEAYTRLLTQSITTAITLCKVINYNIIIEDEVSQASSFPCEDKVFAPFTFINF